MKKKIIKEYSKFFNREVTIIINDELKPSPTTGNGLVARKLAKANESLSKMKSLPKLSHEK
jgi:hypothetical protein